MRILFPVFGILQLTLWLAWGQGMQSYKDADEERAVQKARALKEMKKAIDGPSAPAPVKLIAGGYHSSAYDTPVPAPGEGGARYEQMKREPLRLSVVTADGLVPLTTYQDPNWQANQTAEAAKRAAEENAGIGRKLESQIKAWRISFFDRNAKLEGDAGEPARTVPLEPGGSARPGNANGEVVAIVEETPSRVAGGQPERKILGFLPSNRSKPAEYRGLQANRQNASAVGRTSKPETAAPGEEVAAARTARGAPESRTVGRETRPARNSGDERPRPGEESFTERDVIDPGMPEPQRNMLSRWFNRKGDQGDDELVATGEEMSLNPASAENQKNFLAHWFDRFDGALQSQPTPEREVKPVKPREERKKDFGALDGAEYLATDAAQAPFHVIDSGPGETYVVELPQGTVGRAHGSGDQWAWMQLDTGLMGLMRKQHLRPAADPEIKGFLAAERASKDPSGSIAKRQQEGGAVAGRAEEPEREPAMAEPAAEVAAGVTSPVTPAAVPEPKEVPVPVQQVLKSLE